MIKQTKMKSDLTIVCQLDVYLIAFISLLSLLHKLISWHWIWALSVAMLVHGSICTTQLSVDSGMFRFKASGVKPYTKAIYIYIQHQSKVCSTFHQYKWEIYYILACYLHTPAYTITQLYSHISKTEKKTFIFITSKKGKLTLHSYLKNRKICRWFLFVLMYVNDFCLF